jgi:hypothetical protein
MKIGLMFAALLTFAIANPSFAQTSNDQFEGEHFTAKVMNVTVAKQNGNVFVTVRFTGKGFPDSFLVGLARAGEKVDDCATLLDSDGGQYVAVTCLPTPKHGWTLSYQGIFMIRPSTDSVFVFQFRPVIRVIDESIRKFNFISNVGVLTCPSDRSRCFGYDSSLQSLSFFNLTKG